MPKRVGNISAAVLSALAMATAVQSGEHAPVPGATQAQARQLPGPPRFGRDIRPILADRCFTCHGPDPGKRQADLRLDQRDAAVAELDGIHPIVPGDAGQSEIWRRINSADSDESMPPPDSRKRPLSDDEKKAIRSWIDAGATYEEHWSFVRPQRHDPPPGGDPILIRNDIDRFVQGRLDEQGLTPLPEADRPTLIRRLFLSVTGLPPTPDEVRAFVADGRADAYERLVDAVLNEEPYRTRMAEHLASMWLDAARYGDTNGIHMDAGRQMWLWRDWLLAALRDNMPFDQFVAEQIAGDLLPEATTSQRIASGFNRNHVVTDEGGAIAEEYLVEYAVDRAATTGSVFLGLTLGCARCHDHKFDPVSQQDFYSFYSFFNSIEEPGLYSQLPDANRAFEPFLEVPTADQREELDSLEARLVAASDAAAIMTPADEEAFAEFTSTLSSRLGLAWCQAPPTEAHAVAPAGHPGSSMTVQSDGILKVTGEPPDTEDHIVTLRTTETDLRIVAIAALADPSHVEGRVGRAPNGNAVLTGVTLECRSVVDPSRVETIPLIWAWASLEQANGDFRVVNALSPNDQTGWAVDGHTTPGGRAAIFLADRRFGYAGGSDITVTLQYRSIYAGHSFGRFRVALAGLSDEALDSLPVADSSWNIVGPFATASAESAFYDRFGPERVNIIDQTVNFGAGNQAWRPDPSLKDETLNRLAEGVSAIFVGRHIFSPSERDVQLSLGSDDGLRVYVNGVDVFSHRIDRSLSVDQENITIRLRPGRNTLVLRIVNTGGESGFYAHSFPRTGELVADLVGQILPDGFRPDGMNDRIRTAWRLNFSENYASLQAEVTSLKEQAAQVRRMVPLTMVMKELDAPRETFVLNRGVYDDPDRARPVHRTIPAALGQMPSAAPADRRGLAMWLTSDSNPLVARVAVNRLWELLFGTGLVRTSEDFGVQGEWPSHPELLDTLAVEFREHQWDVRHIIRMIVTSAAFRRSSEGGQSLRAADPDNRLLARFPRRRLSAEQIRDQALFAAGLLVEKLGGPSVKPYQPEGLWQEVAMLGSNTREYVQGEGDALWRRSLYTYWKRASPPPTLLTLDAPTRESCTIRRITTNTPLQALALWNDVQFVEAARVLAQRTLSDGSLSSDLMRIQVLFLRCTGRVPDASETGAILDALADFRTRYRAGPADAERLISQGSAPRDPQIDAAELAAWTMIANSVLNLSATVTLN